MKLPKVTLWSLGLAILGSLLQPWTSGRGVGFWLFVATMTASTTLVGIGWFSLQRQFAAADREEAEALELMDKWQAQRMRGR